MSLLVLLTTAALHSLLELYNNIHEGAAEAGGLGVDGVETFEC